MEVIVELPAGNSFSLVVHPFHTVVDIKVKVHNLFLVPISYQTFLFDGQLLPDDLPLWRSGIIPGSLIKLIVAPTNAATLAPPTMSYSPMPLPQPQTFGLPEAPPPLQLALLPDNIDGLPAFPPQLPPFPGYIDPYGMPEFQAPPQQAPIPHNYDPLMPIIPHMPSADMLPLPLQLMPSKIVTLNVRFPKSKHRVPIDMDLDDTVVKLKEKILLREDMQGLQKEWIVLQLHETDEVLVDDQVLRDCGVSTNTDINTILEEVGGSEGSGKLTVKVLPQFSNENIEIEVNGMDKVSVLREKVDELHRTRGGFSLPDADGYSFYHNKRVLYEKESFEWHEIKEGDTIQISDGYNNL